MARFKNSKTGMVVSVSEEKASRFGTEWERVDGGSAPPAAPTGYAALTVPELKAEIGRRNEGRAPADHLVTEGRKADLVAALEAHDANPPTGYAALTVDELKAEIGRRNEGRAAADELLTDGDQAGLIAELEADDAK